MTNAQRKKERAAKHNAQYEGRNLSQRFARILAETAAGLEADKVSLAGEPVTQEVLATKSTSGPTPDMDDLAIASREFTEKLFPEGGIRKGEMTMFAAMPERVMPSQVDDDNATPPKQYVNVGTIGHIDHGKTTLTSALVRVLANRDKLSPETDPTQK